MPPTDTWERLLTLDAKNDAEELAGLFAAGKEPDGPHGDCEGVVLGLFGPAYLAAVDVLVRVGRLLGGIGWTGKTFSPDGYGFNRLTKTSRVPMFLAMPRYGFDHRGDELLGFHFEHRIEPSPADPDRIVRSVIYDNPAHANPLVLPRTRDELVELDDGVFLGRALLREEDDSWQLVAYFALREPEAV